MFEGEANIHWVMDSENDHEWIANFKNGNAQEEEYYCVICGADLNADGYREVVFGLGLD